MQFLKRFSIGLFVIVIIGLAIIMGSLRLAIVNIGFFKSEIDYLLEKNASLSIDFTNLGGDFNRFNPILRIENASITLADNSQPLFIDRLEVEIDFWASLRERAPVVLEIAGKLEKLELVKDRESQWWPSEPAIGGDPETMVMPLFAQVLALVPRYLKLDLKHLILRDQKYGVSHHLERVTAQIHHKNDQFFMQASAALPDALGRGVLVKSIVGPENSEIYINSSDLHLAPVAALFDLNTWGLQRGALDGEIWINMSGFDVNTVNGDLVLKNGLVRLSSDEQPLAVNYRLRFSAANRDSDWRITNEIDRLEIDNENLPGFRSQLTLTTTAGEKVISAWIDRLQLTSASLVASQWLPPSVGRQLAQTKLHGLLQDIVLRIDLNQPDSLQISGRAVGISSSNFGNYPGTNNLNAEFLLGNRRLVASLSGKAVSLDFGDQFKAPIKVDRLALTARAQLHSDQLVLALDKIEASNQDIAVAGRLWMEADNNDLPWVYLRARFTDAKGASTREYIPLKLMPKKTQAWLSRGIVDGHVPEGDLQYHGRLRDLRRLQRDRSGEFFVDFAIEKADVDFAPGWLHATNGNGRVLFHNAGVEFELDRVSYDQIESAQARGRIKSFGAAVLELEINSGTSTAKALHTWIETPVGARYRDTVDNLHDLEGNVEAAVKIRLPLTSVDVRREVDVLVEFKDAAAKADAWGLELTQISGQLNVTEDRFSARQIKAMYFDDPIRIDVGTAESSGNAIINASGTIHTKHLLKLLPESFGRAVAGKSDWQIRLDVADAIVSRSADKPHLRINAASRLKQTEIKLPPPFRKQASESIRFATELNFFPGQIRFNANLGVDTKARGDLRLNANQEFELNGVDLAFGVALKPQWGSGLNLYGNLNELHVDDWKAVIDASEGPGSNLLRSAQLNIQRLHVFNRVNDDVYLELNQVSSGYSGFIDSSLIKGRLEWPRQPSAKSPIVATLDYLRIDEQEHVPDYTEIRPGDLADLRVSSKKFVFHEMQYHDLYFDARIRGDLLQVEEFRLRRDNVNLQGSAEWQYDSAKQTHLSTVDARIKGPGLGEALSGVGFGDTMSSGKIDFTGDFSWPAPLLQFEFANLVGNAKLKIENGVLNNVEPGGGRFVGLFSISALPRRLALDFSDIFIKGLEFDRIRGNYRLEKGVLKTQNTRIDGPAAKIKIAGETGIIERDYNQLIRVTPKIGDTLPLVGGALYGSTAGWALLLLKNLFKRRIDDAVEVEYKVTGSWDDPQIELKKAVDENQQELPKIEK